MPRKSHQMITQGADESHDEFFHRLHARRRENAASRAEYIEQPHMLKQNNVPLQSTRKDTALPQPLLKARPTGSSEDEVEF